MDMCLVCSSIQKKAYEKGYQQTLFSGIIPVETSFDFSYKFCQYYPIDKKYSGRIKFNKCLLFS